MMIAWLVLGICCTLVQALFWVGVWFLFRRSKPAAMTSGFAPPVTVLVCARNEELNLRRHLPLWLGQAYPDFEVLMVDDASTDGSAELLDEWAGQDSRLRVLHIPEKVSPGKKAALELGLRNSRHEWVLLTDADCRPAGTDWIGHMASEISPGTDLVLGYGPADAPNTWIGRWHQFETFYTGVQYMGLALAGQPYMGVGRNLLYRRGRALDVLNQLAGAHLPGGDDDLLVNRIARGGNTRVALHPESFTYTEAPGSRMAWLRQKRRHFSTGKYYRWQHRLLLGSLALSQALSYLVMVGLLVVGKPGWAGGLYAARLLLYWPSAASLAGRLDSKAMRRYLPLMDLWLPGYYLLFARSIFLQKTGSRW